MYMWLRPLMENFADHQANWKSGTTGNGQPARRPTWRRWRPQRHHSLIAERALGGTRLRLWRTAFLRSHVIIGLAQRTRCCMFALRGACVRWFTDQSIDTILIVCHGLPSKCNIIDSSSCEVYGTLCAGICKLSCEL